MRPNDVITDVIKDVVSGGAMRQQILTGVERRRRWSTVEKLRIVAEAAVEGVSLAEIARQHDLTRQQIYQWRSELRSKGLLAAKPTTFVWVELTAEGPFVEGH